MNQVIFKTGDIVDEDTDGLVCSGNIQLNMSGGVNGELLLRGGTNMQRQLHEWLMAQTKKYVEPGFVMRIGPEPFRFKSIVYTVAVNGWYESSVEVTKKALVNAMTLLEQDQCETISVPALATGYGNLSPDNFGRALRLAIHEKAWAFREIRVVLRDLSDLEQVKRGYA